MEYGYDFDDVLIKPLPSSISSRDDVDIKVSLGDDFVLDFPLIATPMVGVTDGAFAHKLSQLGGLAILHRFYKSRKHLIEDIEHNLSLDDWNRDNYGIAIKIGEENIDELYDYNPRIILIDTANGYIKSLLKYCEKVKTSIIKSKQNILLMAGNVVTAEGCKNLHEAGCDMIRIGIGGGSPCSTRNVTGIGMPNLSALMDCDQYIPTTNSNVLYVMDGGLRNSGDFVKSIVAGADLGMAGHLYAECYESPNEGTLYGMASRTHMENIKTNIKSVEGFDVQITKRHSLEQFVSEFGYGIKSAGTYLNARNLTEIYIYGEFIKVSDQSIKKEINSK